MRKKETVGIKNCVPVYGWKVELVLSNKSKKEKTGREWTAHCIPKFGISISKRISDFVAIMRAELQ